MAEKINLSSIMTEGRNPDTVDIDQLDSLGVVTKINNEDKKIAFAVERCLPEIAKAVDYIVEAFGCGGRLLYIGAGTSGRLGILDASECPPTYGVDASLVQGIIAGGDIAIHKAVENAEDSLTMASDQLEARGLRAEDVVVGLAASGRTPYVIGGLQFAKSVGCKTVAVCCSANSPLVELADVTIALLCGPEAVTGSTRMKAGTAQKMVLNMLSTAAMVRTGKVYSNLMIDVQATNEKLRQRANRIVCLATGVDEKQADTVLKAASGSVKLAVTMLLGGMNAAQAQQALTDNNGFVAGAIAGRQL